MERCCGTCKWHLYENIDEGFVCANIDSEYCADWTDYADWRAGNKGRIRAGEARAGCRFV